MLLTLKCCVPPGKANRATLAIRWVRNASHKGRVSSQFAAIVRRTETDADEGREKGGISPNRQPPKPGGARQESR